jgi:hypothetical protein
MVGAAASNISQKAPLPAAIISHASSLAPVTDLRWKARKATKNETKEVVIKNTEYMVKTRSMLFYQKRRCKLIIDFEIFGYFIGPSQKNENMALFIRYHNYTSVLCLPLHVN